MKNPLVSVILPNYNHAKYLPQRIKSILNQTYQNFELIILDDKSSDNSREVISRYKSNPHISHIIFNDTNSGSTFKQWNLGFSKAKGDIIWIAESDDYCEPTFLERCVKEYIKEPETAIVFSTSRLVDSEGKYIKFKYDLSTPLNKYSGKRFIKEKMCCGNAIWNASSAIFNKKMALQIDKQYMDYVAAGDKLFWIELAEKGKVVHINEFMNYFRQHNNKVSPQKLLDGTTLLEEKRIYNYLVKSGYIKGLKKNYVLDYFFNRIVNETYTDESIKYKLLSLWSFNSKNKIYAVKIISRIYMYSYKFFRKELLW